MISTSAKLQSSRKVRRCGSTRGTLESQESQGNWYTGPYLVKWKVGNLAYKLKLPKDLVLHPVFHVSLLLLHRESQLPGRHLPEPASIEVEGEEEYEVEEVLDKGSDLAIFRSSSLEPAYAV